MKFLLLKLFPKAPSKNVIAWIQIAVAVSLPIRCRTLCGVLALREFHYDLEKDLKDEERVALPSSWEKRGPRALPILQRNPRGGRR